MFGRFNLTDEDWRHTPAAVQQAFSSLHHQLLLVELRCQAYEHQLALSREQVAQIEDLKAELAELRERLNQDSNNSTKPPSSDPPHQRHTISNESKCGKRGGQRGHRGQARKLKAVTQVDQLIDLKPLSCKDCGQLLSDGAIIGISSRGG
jgi:transposase